MGDTKEGPSFQILDLSGSASLKPGTVCAMATQRTVLWGTILKVNLLGVNFTSTITLVALFRRQGNAGHGVISTSSSFDFFEPAKTANH